MGNGNSTSSKSKVHGHTAKAGSTEPQYVPRQGKPSTKDQVGGFPHGTKRAAFRGEYNDKPQVERQQHQHGLGVYSGQHGKKSLDNDDTFTEYIRRAKQKIRTVSNIGREHRNPAPAAAPDVVANGTNNRENQNDQFSEFIQLAKKKLRTTTRVGKNGSFKRR